MLTCDWLVTEPANRNLQLYTWHLNDWKQDKGQFENVLKTAAVTERYTGFIMIFLWLLFLRKEQDNVFLKIDDNIFLSQKAINEHWKKAFSVTIILAVSLFHTGEESHI